MTFRLVVREEALEEIRAIQTYLEQERSGLGRRFRVELLECLDDIVRYPEGYQVRWRSYRYGQLAKLRYHVIYEVREREVVIYHVRHMHRRTLKRFFGP